MRNIRIYQDIPLAANQSIALDKAASNHLIKVLRLKNQQVFTLFNGTGSEYPATLEVSGKHAVAHLQNQLTPITESQLNIHLLQGISKGDRMDIAIQKSVELGVTRITPVFCNRTVVNLKGDRLEKKLQHWRAIAISACEQCGRNIVPEISTPINFNAAIHKDSDSLNILLDPLSDTPVHNLSPVENQLRILIGPEGGLTDEEIDLAISRGYMGIRLGPRILRTETAALAAITTAQALWGDFN